MDELKEKMTNFKEQVRQAADLLTIVSETVSLKRRGTQYWDAVPFMGRKRLPSRWIRPGGCSTASAAGPEGMCSRT